MRHREHSDEAIILGSGASTNEAIRSVIECDFASTWPLSARSASFAQEPHAPCNARPDAT